MLQVLAFYLFTALMLSSAVAVIFARNPVHSVLWLIMAFFNGAGLMVLAGAEFIAMLLVIVYVGAVAVLFLFVVMMLDIDFAELRAGALKLGHPLGDAAPLADASNIKSIGALLYGKYLFLFETAGIILLVAMVGAIVLTHRRVRAPRGQQNISKQIARKPSEATVNTRPEVGQGVQL